MIYISLTHTSLSNGDRDKFIIPNSEVLGQVIVNHTGIPGARLKATLQIEGEHDRDEIMAFILGVAESFEPQLRGPNDRPSVTLTDAGTSYGVKISTYQVMVIVPEANYGENSKLFLHLRRALDARANAASAQPVAA